VKIKKLKTTRQKAKGAEVHILHSLIAIELFILLHCYFRVLLLSRMLI